jgi:two-component system response regulator MprA
MTPADLQNPGTATILVVEDDTDTREFIVMLLSMAGYRTLEAGSGTAALSMISGQPVQAITLDHRLPDMNGLEVCRHLRTHGYPDIPIILVTADRTPNLDRNAGAVGVTAVIEKPFPMEALPNQLARLLAA